LAAVLDSKLSFTEDGLIKDWYDNLYSFRNRIVHSGKAFVSGNQAYKAYDVYVGARNYITELLVKKGYLSQTGKIDLKAFTKNSRKDVDSDTIRKRLVEKGIVPADLPFIKK